MVLSYVNDQCFRDFQVYNLRFKTAPTFYNGVKDDFEDGNAKFITYMNVFANPSLKTTVDDKVRIEEGEKQNVIKYGDVLFTGSSETPDECGMSSVLEEHTDEHLYLNSFCFGYRFNDIQTVVPAFFKHLFRCNYVRAKIAKTANGVTRFNISKKLFGEIEIPIPNTEIQKEIADQLDGFTSVIENLEAELASRQKQYEYYRNKLLTFDKDDESVEWKTISEVADNYTGLTYKPNNISSEGTLVLRSSNIQDYRLNFEDNVFVTEIKIPERAKAKEGDILVCVRNGSRTLVGKCAMITTKAAGMAFGAFMTVLRCKLINNKYLFYIWQTYKVVKQYKGDDAMPINQITSKDFSRIVIPVVSIERQQEIVSILDTFESLITNLKQEIELRKKQYEYYREQLLTFE